MVQKELAGWHANASSQTMQAGRRARTRNSCTYNASVCTECLTRYACVLARERGLRLDAADAACMNSGLRARAHDARVRVRSMPTSWSARGNLGA
eukprot:6210649-Pleurochrysis_carterae.AAC.12